MSLPVTNELLRQLFDLFTLSPVATAPVLQPATGAWLSPASALRVPVTHGRASGSTRASPAAGDCLKPPLTVELTTDALEQILIRCDIDTLIGTVPAVCKAWRAAATLASLWRHRLSPKLLSEFEPLAALGPSLAPSRLFLILQGRNFLRNPTFRRDANTQPQLGRAASKSKWQRNAWVTTTVMGDGVSWELPPAGIRTYDTAAAATPPSPLPYPGNGPRITVRVQQQLQSLFGTGSGGFGNGGSAARGWEEHQQGCLATANDWCEVVQVVDLDWELQRRGLSAAQAAHLLDAELSLRLSVHVGCRWDCVGQYSVGLILDEGNGNANGYGYGAANASAGGSGGGGSSGGGGATDDSIPSLQSFIMRPTRHHFYTGRACCTSDNWQRFEYTLPACPRGFRRAVVILRGRRAPNSMIVSPMPRYCGAKFASAELVFA